MKKNTIEEEKSIWEKKLNTLFSKKEKSEVDTFMQVVSMVIYNNVANEDIANLYANVDLNTFITLVNLFGGRRVEFPTRRELKDAIELALFYYYKQVQGITDYSQLKELSFVDKENFSPISIGKKLKKLQKEIVSKLENIEDLFDEDEV